ncbi:MAG: phosphatase PAP2 family protein [Thermoleophilia bacterium]|nr:phosphatase PAP2 family protein [Thermoleophilia bacterium]
MGELDRDAYTWITDHRVGWLDPLFLVVTAIGYAGLLWVGLAVALALLHRRPLLPVVLAVGGAVWSVDLLVQILKEVIERPRPFRAIPGADPLTTFSISYSLPSGHAATSFAGAVMLAVFFRRALPWLLVLAVAVAYSRVYVGVHYPADVIAGAALGTAWALGWLAVFRALRPQLSGLARVPARRRRGAYSDGAP